VDLTDYLTDYQQHDFAASGHGHHSAMKDRGQDPRPVRYTEHRPAFRPEKCPGAVDECMEDIPLHVNRRDPKRGKHADKKSRWASKLLCISCDCKHTNA
jgi:hypothetical protein